MDINLLLCKYKEIQKATWAGSVSDIVLDIH